MKPLRIKPLLFAALAVFAALPAFAAELSPQVAAVRDRWAEVKYALPAGKRDAAFEALARDAEAARAAAPRDAGALIWEGIVLSSWAGEKGGLGALGLVKKARKDFEAAIAVDPAALDGSAYTSLGSLYYQVPGWPVGFGDDDKARELLAQGLAMNPDGIDANYFQADFLREQEDYAGAEQALLKALAAPARPGRERADAGRRAEAEAMLAQVRAELASR
jgi:tetratricopeptide (TPR) repeat protein